MGDPDDKETLVVPRAAAYAFAAIVAGGGGSLVVDTIKDPRPDPYTGSDGLRDKVEIMGKLERMGERMDKTRDRLHAMDLEHQQLRHELTTLRSMLIDISKHLEDHKDSKHPSKPH